MPLEGRESRSHRTPREIETLSAVGEKILLYAVPSVLREGIKKSTAAGEKLKIPRKKEEILHIYTVIIDEVFLLQILMY